MTNIRRPIHMALRPNSISFSSTLGTTCSTPKPLSPSADSLPSQIVSHLYVGNLEQTNRDTVNRLNISYILSLGLLPLISTRSSPSSPTPASATTCAGSVTLPSHNSSIDFKIRLRANGLGHSSPTPTLDQNENKGVRRTRNVYCKCINIFDNNQENLEKFFDEAYQFIEEARRKKCNILIHCLAGISRSPAVAIAYLMKVNSMRFQDAFDLVKQSRPQIDPSMCFRAQLYKYEKEVSRRESSNSTTNTDKDNQDKWHSC